MSNTSFPFSVPNGQSLPQSFAYDVVIQEAFPGLVQLGTEPNSVYTAFREVSGASWWVINADFDANQGFWTQNDTCNANLPAYAMVQDRTGNVTRYRTDATTLPNTQITWVAVWQVADQGNIIRTPTVYAQAVRDMANGVTWNMGTSTRAVARYTAITDTSSAANSMLEQNFVNNVEVLSWDKTGTLTAGIIPYARITGAPPPFTPTNPTFTGTATFNGPIIATTGETITGGLTTDTLTVTGNSTLHNTTATDMHAQTLEVDGASSFHAANFNGAVTTTSGIPLVGLTSTDGTILVTSPSNNSWNVSQASPYPALITNSYTIPAVGSNVSVTYRSNTGFPLQSYCIIAANGGGPQILGQLQSTSGSGGTLTSVFKCLKIYSGSVGQVIAANSAYIFPGSYDPSITTQGQTFATATNFPAGSTMGTLAFATALPGTSANSYLVICSGSLQFQNASRNLILTGSGTSVSWPSSPQTYQNANAGTFPFFFYGIAAGGSTPSVTWTCNDSLFAEPMTMVMVAYFQS